MTANPLPVCLLTGASGRLGSLFCQLYGHRYRILAVHCSRPVPRPAEVIWHIDPFNPGVRQRIEGRGVATLQADLSDPAQIPRVVDSALDRFGRVDVLVNAAAICHRVSLTGSEPVAEHVAAMLDMNAVVPLRLAVELAQRFWRGRTDENAALNRSIVNISSTSGAYIYSNIGQSGYAASKAALHMLTCHLADEFADLGLRANTVAPDAFPERVTTASVCDAIARVAAGDMNGRMLLLEPSGESVV
jgi:NAD(P)-dependent dehydrogenase (short-subunit alcohol dehydrogenase family)